MPRTKERKPPRQLRQLIERGVMRWTYETDCVHIANDDKNAAVAALLELRPSCKAADPLNSFWKALKQYHFQPARLGRPYEYRCVPPDGRPVFDPARPELDQLLAVQSVSGGAASPSGDAPLSAGSKRRRTAGCVVTTTAGASDGDSSDDDGGVVAPKRSTASGQRPVEPRGFAHLGGVARSSSGPAGGGPADVSTSTPPVLPMYELSGISADVADTLPHSLLSLPISPVGGAGAAGPPPSVPVLPLPHSGLRAPSIPGGMHVDPSPPAADGAQATVLLGNDSTILGGDSLD